MLDFTQTTNILAITENDLQQDEHFGEYSTSIQQILKRDNRNEKSLVCIIYFGIGFILFDFYSHVQYLSQHQFSAHSIHLTIYLVHYSFFFLIV